MFGAKITALVTRKPRLALNALHCDVVYCVVPWLEHLPPCSPRSLSKNEDSLFLAGPVSTVCGVPGGIWLAVGSHGGVLTQGGFWGVYDLGDVSPAVD
jgi:hypothetical protein